MSNVIANIDIKDFLRRMPDEVLFRFKKDVMMEKMRPFVKKVAPVLPLTFLDARLVKQARRVENKLDELEEEYRAMGLEPDDILYQGEEMDSANAVQFDEYNVKVEIMKARREHFDLKQRIEDLRYRIKVAVTNQSRYVVNRITVRQVAAEKIRRQNDTEAFLRRQDKNPVMGPEAPAGFFSAYEKQKRKAFPPGKRARLLEDWDDF